MTHTIASSIDRGIAAVIKTYRPGSDIREVAYTDTREHIRQAIGHLGNTILAHTDKDGNVFAGEWGKIERAEGIVRAAVWGNS